MKLPTTLKATIAKDGQSVELRFRYDEGKGRFVESTESIRLDTKTAMLVEVDLQEKHRSDYSVSGLKEFLATGSGDLLLTGNGEENHEKVEVRKTVTLRENALTILKQTRLPGKSFVFRNCYSFQRTATKQP